MTTNENKRATLLQRLPAILAVTAHSYGLSLEPQAVRKHGERRRAGPHQAQAAFKATQER